MRQTNILYWNSANSKKYLAKMERQYMYIYLTRILQIWSFLLQTIFLVWIWFLHILFKISTIFVDFLLLSGFFFVRPRKTLNTIEWQHTHSSWESKIEMHKPITCRYCLFVNNFCRRYRHSGVLYVCDTWFFLWILWLESRSFDFLFAAYLEPTKLYICSFTFADDVLGFVWFRI